MAFVLYVNGVFSGEGTSVVNLAIRYFPGQLQSRRLCLQIHGCGAYALHRLQCLLHSAVVAFVLYVNGVFSGEGTSVVNLAINLGFLVVIGVLFFVSFASVVFFTSFVNPSRKPLSRRALPTTKILLRLMTAAVTEAGYQVTGIAVG